MDNSERYKTFVAIYKKAHQYTGGTDASILSAAQKLWNRVKKSSDEYEKVILELKIGDYSKTVVPRGLRNFIRFGQCVLIDLGGVLGG